MLSFVPGAALLAEEQPGTGLELQVSSETVPPGGMAQVKVFAATPHAIESGSLAMEFDPAVFGDIVDVLALSASGDVIGLAELDGRRFEARFNAFSGGVGRLPALPILTVSIPVLAGAPEGTTSAVTVDLTDAVWKDIQGNELSVSAIPGSVTVGGELSVHKVTPSAGVAPAGTTVTIEGRGFALSTIVEAPELVLSQVRYVNPELMELTLGAPAEMTGARFRLRNPDGPEVLVYAPVSRTPAETVFQGKRIRPFFSRLTFNHIDAGRGFTHGLSGTGYRAGIALENHTPAAVRVTVEEYGGVVPASRGRNTFTIPSGELATVDQGFVGFPGHSLYAFASVPLRMVALQFKQTTDYSLDPEIATTRELSALIPGTDGPRHFSSPHSVDWEWQIGSAVPAAKSLEITDGARKGVDSVVAVTTEAGGDWLSVVSTGEAGKYDVSVDPSSLGPGVYMGSITASAVDSALWPVTIPVSLHVTSLPPLEPSRSNLHFRFGSTESEDTPASQPLEITSGGTPVDFSVSARTDSGSGWLSVTPSSGTTPATLTVSVVPPPGTGDYDGAITLTGPESVRTVRVSLQTYGDPSVWEPTPSSVVFSWTEGDPTLLEQDIYPIWPRHLQQTATVSTQSGGDWLHVNFGFDTYRDYIPITIQASAEGLAAGVYEGNVSISIEGHPPVDVPVTLSVWKDPPPITVSPPSLSFVGESRGRAPSGQWLHVSSGGVPVTFTSSSSMGGGVPINTNPYSGGAITPVDLGVFIGTSTNVPPGIYEGVLEIISPGGTVEVPLSFTVTPGPADPPLPVSIVNAASQALGAVSPGEIVALHGLSMGPPFPAGLVLDPDGKVSNSIGGTRVFFEGFPAPLTYASLSQVNAIVPYEIKGRESVAMEVEYNGVRSTPVCVRVEPSAPGIFTQTSTGVGAASVLQLDNSTVTPANPAVRGAIIQIYATGEGQTSPDGVTGSLIEGLGTHPVLPVRVTIGGYDAAVDYAGPSPGSVSGLFQVNAIVPYDVEPGEAVPIELTVGESRSQHRATIAVE